VPATAHGTTPRRFTDQLMRPQAIALIVALLAGGGFLATRGGDGDDTASAPTVQVGGEVLREPVTVAGPDPFTASVATSSTTTPTSSTTTIATTSTTAAPTTVGGTVVLASTGGGTPGLYGGTLNNAECNKEQLVSFLEQNPDKAQAWARVQEIEPSQIREYVGQLTPVALEADTRVTNHGFLSGQATPRQAVLQKGSAVLIDKFGEPRARCYCGNPLRAPVAQTSTTTFAGPSWPAFNPGNLQAVTPAPAPVDAFVLKDDRTGQGINRPAGSSGAQDTPAPPPPPLPEPKDRPAPTITTSSVPSSTVPITTTRPTTTAVVTRPASIPAPNAFIQKEGAVQASSTDPTYPVALAIDGNPATSWFSRGSNVDGPTTTFTWTYPREELITHVKIVSNAANSTVAFRRNYGYASVTIRVLDAANAIDFEQTVPLPGTPDPDAFVQPGVRGRSVQLVFSGGEAPDCGGFAELEVGVTR
jgi:hypothetical protein